jgi:hypothetical protein
MSPPYTAFGIGGVEMKITEPDGTVSIYPHISNVNNTKIHSEIHVTYIM